jgi:hypothetical protein
MEEGGLADLARADEDDGSAVGGGEESGEFVDLAVESNGALEVVRVEGVEGAADAAEFAFAIDLFLFAEEEGAGWLGGSLGLGAGLERDGEDGETGAADEGVFGEFEESLAFDLTEVAGEDLVGPRFKLLAGEDLEVDFGKGWAEPKLPIQGLVAEEEEAELLGSGVQVEAQLQGGFLQGVAGGPEGEGFVAGFGTQLVEVVLEVGGESGQGAAELVGALDEGGGEGGADDEGWGLPAIAGKLLDEDRDVEVHECTCPVTVIIWFWRCSSMKDGKVSDQSLVGQLRSPRWRSRTRSCPVR